MYCLSSNALSVLQCIACPLQCGGQTIHWRTDNTLKRTDNALEDRQYIEEDRQYIVEERQYIEEDEQYIGGQTIH
jgi:hypothetical protein